MRLTKEQGVILTGFTGIMCCIMSDFHQDAEKRTGKPIYTHQFADKELWIELKELYKEDFLSIMPKGTTHED